MNVTAREAGHSEQQHTAAGALSPLRKAMSLSLLFRNHSSNAAVISAPVPEQKAVQTYGQQTENASSNSTTPPTISKPLGRVRRRLSLRSTSVSPATSSALTSPTLATPPASLRGRPRSGSCRASFLGGGGAHSIGAGRILPFTLPTLGQSYSEDRFGADMIRTTSLSPCVPPPKRPTTPAPLLVLDEDQDNCLGIIADTSAAHCANAAASRASHGLGLSAPILMSRPLNNRFSLSSAAMESKESFHCRGNKEDVDQDIYTSVHVKQPSASHMTRSVSANPVTSTSNASRIQQAPSSSIATIVPGSSLGYRRRPWALSLQLQSPPTASVLAAISARQPPHTARTYAEGFSPMQIDDSHGHSYCNTAPPAWPPSADDGPRSRFSLSSSNIDMIDEDQHLGVQSILPSASQTTSPTFTWSSSAYSFDTTLESPQSRRSTRFSATSIDRNSLFQQQRRRSNTIGAIPVYTTPTIALSQAQSTKNDDDDDDDEVLTIATSLDDVGELRRPSWIAGGDCPSSPPSHVRLRLTLPPTAVAKHRGVPHEFAMQMPMTASTLDFKEAICTSLRARHRLSISPSQLALFVIDNSSAAAADLSPRTRAHSPSLLSTSPRSWTTSPITALKRSSPSSPTTSSIAPLDATSPTSTSGFLRPRSRLRRRLSGNQCTIAAAATVGAQQPDAGQHATMAVRYRQLENDAVLYQEGLQDDDNVIVRF